MILEIVEAPTLGPSACGLGVYDHSWIRDGSMGFFFGVRFGSAGDSQTS